MKPSLLVLLLSLGAAAAVQAGSFQGEAGLQLYSLRDQFKTDVPGTLDKVKGYGVKEVETATTYGLKPEEYRKMLEERGLKAISGHWQYDSLKKDVEGAIRE